MILTINLPKFNQHWKSSWKVSSELERDISIDESLLLWKRRLSWKQCIPNKRSRFGLKAFVLSEGSTGYVWNIILYTGGDAIL